ncbi:indolepyruvate ferredoxin oxidoreductase family protein [Nonomuraea typhae]|uniref:indolepyruvate ferredoxin oxidoreductase family protein n=1 Tax=Nonomuraea typhae TaxID=2603600 RepID=UPI0012F85314|nr:indolepyruvate ferredoxin oxidoreductase family protein [Nonomuraea typhae]
MPPDNALDDKYTRSDGRVLMTGVQALVRLTLEQRRLDEARGLDTRVFVSGYRGSPLGGVDLEMERAARFLGPAGVVFGPGLNEELAATAVAGTQLLGRAPGRLHEAVTGFWYGKNPGLDRAADAVRHGMVTGTAPLGGVVAWIGDDPACKSSSVPSSCEQMCQSLSMPLLVPGSVGEVVELGLHAVALSRASGLWVGLKMLSDVADGSATVDLTSPGDRIPMPDPSRAGAAGLGAAVLEAEHDMRTRRLDLARAYARANGLNRVTHDPEGATLGVIAPGGAYAAVLRAVADLGTGEKLRLIKLAMPYPLADDELVELTRGLKTVLVVEDKVSFVESRLKEALYRCPDAPDVIGRELLTAKGTLTADDVAGALTVLTGGPRRREPLAGRPLPVVAARAPFFCSGCPHNTSTRTDDDTLVGAGIGCHAMIALDGKGRGTQLGLTQMGGEGAQWFGIAPFTRDRHFVQNLGDGTFHHSGSLAIRAAVDAGVTMTYKLLYNDAVAMTGGQRAEGRLDVPTLTRWLAAEGVRKVIVTTADPASYRGARLDPIASVRHRDEFAAAERSLAALDGVTVLIHDDRCAAEERRLRKRGLLPAPKEKVVINERVCEGCGDCAEQSTCLSVHPVETPFGGKTRIHQASCNTDLSCLKGDCPSFLLVTPGTRRKKAPPPPPGGLPEPERRFEEVLIRMPGIGGTGVVTVSQVLQMAARLDGRHAAGVDQTGLAQKGGPVVSDLRISARPIDGAVKAGQRTADVLLALDLIGAAADANLAAARPGHTIAVVNTTLVPTLGMITHRAALPSSPADALERIESVTDADHNLYLDAQGLAERLFADHLPANLLLVGAAFQHGCLPLSAEAIERAIRLNGAAVEKNLAAFRWGRAAVLEPPEAVPPQDAPGMELWLADLADYHSPAYARRFADAVREVETLVAERVDEETGRALTAAYARNLHKLMTYKDEYEVARLHLDPAEKARRVAEFGPDAKETVLLHPPVLRALGMKRKIRLRRTAGPIFRLLRAARKLRGTRFDPFGGPRVRRVERALIPEYRQLMARALERLNQETADQVAAIAALPDLIRGYEDIKLARVAEFRERAAQALAELAAGVPR